MYEKLLAGEQTIINSFPEREIMEYNYFLLTKENASSHYVTALKVLLKKTLSCNNFVNIKFSHKEKVSWSYIY